MKPLKITAVDGQIYVDGVGQDIFIGAEFVPLAQRKVYYDLHIEAEQFREAAETILQNFNLPRERMKPLRLCIVIAMHEDRKRRQANG